jgi:hypothetical protein
MTGMCALLAATPATAASQSKEPIRYEHLSLEDMNLVVRKDLDACLFSEEWADASICNLRTRCKQDLHSTEHKKLQEDLKFLGSFKFLLYQHSPPRAIAWSKLLDVVLVDCGYQPQVVPQAAGKVKQEDNCSEKVRSVLANNFPGCCKYCSAFAGPTSSQLVGFSSRLLPSSAEAAGQ